jgi:hypothetical protein
MLYTVIFLVLTVLATISLAGVLLLLICRIDAQIRRKTNPRQRTRLKRTVIFLVVTMVLDLALVTITQLTALHPPLPMKTGIHLQTVLQR